jgi:hypothetical protein
MKLVTLDSFMGWARVLPQALSYLRNMKGEAF